MIVTPFGMSAEQTAEVLAVAGRAPSLHNSQPWAYRLTSDRIELFADPARSLVASDPEGRETRLACGAALFNLRLGLARRGISTTVSIEAKPGDGPLAVLEHGGNFTFSPDRAELERAIAHRRTNRRPFFEAEVPSGHQLILGRAAEAERATLVLITDPGRLAHLRQWAASAREIQQADPAWVAEWRHWSGREGGADGVPVSAAGPASAPQDRWAVRDFGRPNRPDRIQGKDFEEHPLIAVLATYSDRPPSHVQAGQALERVLLAATTLGLAASFLSQLIEVPSIRRQVGQLVGSGLHPQAVLRIGFGGPVPTTPRRPVRDCLLPEPVAQR